MSAVMKNLNLYWVGSTLLALWFFLIHTPPILISRHITLFTDPIFAVHLVGVVGIYAACIHNSLVTPSVFRTTHVWIGRVGMPLGVIGFVTGAWMAWTRIDANGMGFAIFITFGGVFQVFSQWLGVRYIKIYQETCREIAQLGDDGKGSPLQLWELEKKKKESLIYHIGNMLGLFVAACGIPAMIRVCDNAPWWIVITVIAGMNIAVSLYCKIFIDRMPPVPEQPPADDDDERPAAPTTTTRLLASSK